jgi:hypothetical protein
MRSLERGPTERVELTHRSNLFETVNDYSQIDIRQTALRPTSPRPVWGFAVGDEIEGVLLGNVSSQFLDYYKQILVLLKRTCDEFDLMLATDNPELFHVSRVSPNVPSVESPLRSLVDALNLALLERSVFPSKFCRINVIHLTRQTCESRRPSPEKQW